MSWGDSRRSATTRNLTARKESLGLATKLPKSMSSAQAAASSRTASRSSKASSKRRKSRRRTASPSSRKSSRRCDGPRRPTQSALKNGESVVCPNAPLAQANLLMATGGSAPFVEVAWRIVVARVLGESAIEGADFSTPSQDLPTRTRMQNACIDESKVGRQLAVARVIDQVGCDETSLNGVSMQASFAKADGRRFTIQAVQVSTTGFGAAACVEDTFTRAHRQYALFRAELGLSAVFRCSLRSRWSKWCRR